MAAKDKPAAQDSVAETTPESVSIETQMRDFDERMRHLETAQANFQESIAASIELLIRQGSRHTYDSTEMERGGDGMAEFSDQGNIVQIDKAPRVDTGDPTKIGKEAESKFLAQIVRVRVMQPQGDNPPPFVDIMVNGERYRFGGPLEKDWNKVHNIPRYVLLQIFQLRPFTYGNVEYTSPSGARAMRYPRSSQRRLEVQVLHDPAGQAGMDWAQKQQAMVA